MVKCNRHQGSVNTRSPVTSSRRVWETRVLSKQINTTSTRCLTKSSKGNRVLQITKKLPTLDLRRAATLWAHSNSQTASKRQSVSSSRATKTNSISKNNNRSRSTDESCRPASRSRRSALRNQSGAYFNHYLPQALRLGLAN